MVSAKLLYTTICS